MHDLLEKRPHHSSLHFDGLTVGEVIAMLETFDPSAPVLIRGENGGFDAVFGARTTPVRLNVNDAEGFGPHEIPGDGERADIVAVVVRTRD